MLAGTPRPNPVFNLTHLSTSVALFDLHQSRRPLIKQARQWRAPSIAARGVCSEAGPPPGWPQGRQAASVVALLAVDRRPGGLCSSKHQVAVAPKPGRGKGMPGTADAGANPGTVFRVPDGQLPNRHTQMHPLPFAAGTRRPPQHIRAKILQTHRRSGSW